MKKAFLIFFVSLFLCAFRFIFSELRYDCWFVGGEKNCALLEEVITSEEKRIGLMNREYLPPHYGMIFVREEESVRSFWMKNTLIPLHILFLDKEKNVVDQTTMYPCEEDPCSSYTSRQPAQYVVELMVRD